MVNVTLLCCLRHALRSAEHSNDIVFMIDCCVFSQMSLTLNKAMLPFQHSFIVFIYCFPGIL